jgi:hypothetical protein
MEYEWCRCMFLRDRTFQAFSFNLWGSLGTCAVSLAVLGFIVKRDVEARNRQIRRMGREEELASCRVALASGKTVKLGALRSFCRPVVFCGTGEQVLV